MSCRRHCSKLILFSLVVLSRSGLWAQGPPYQTDDPVPVDLHHYDFYIFGSTDGTPVETDATGPAVGFNWGAIPRVQLHTISPLGVIAPANNPSYSPDGIGPSAFRRDRCETGREDRHHQRIQVHTPDRHLYDDRTADWKLQQRTWSGKGLVQTSLVVPEEYWTLDPGCGRW
jgi:hypothetical protein